MKNKIIKIALAIFVVIVFISECVPKVKNGFVEEGGYTYYYVNDEICTGWKDVEENTYFFVDEKLSEEKGQPLHSMLKDSWVESDGRWFYFDSNGKMIKKQFAEIRNNTYYFDDSGVMLHDAQIEKGGETYILGSDGVGTKVPDYQLVFNCTFPKTFRYGDYVWCDVTIENIKFEVVNNRFKTYWTGFAGNAYDGPNTSTKRGVSWKLYDPENYVIASGFFLTSVSLKMGEKFKDTEDWLGWGDEGKLKTKGIYRLELMDTK